MNAFLFPHLPFDCAKFQVLRSATPLLLKREGERVLIGSSTPHLSVFWFFDVPPPLRSACRGDEFLCAFALLSNLMQLWVLAHKILIRELSAFLGFRTKGFCCFNLSALKDFSALGSSLLRTFLPYRKDFSALDSSLVRTFLP